MDNDTAWRGVIRWYGGDDFPPATTTWEDVFRHFRVDTSALEGEVIYRACLLTQHDFKVVQDPAYEVKKVRTGRAGKPVQSWTTSESFARGWADENHATGTKNMLGDYVSCVVGAKFPKDSLLSYTRGLVDRAQHKPAQRPFHGNEELMDEARSILDEYYHEDEVQVQLDTAEVVELRAATGKYDEYRNYEYAPVVVAKLAATEADRRSNREHMQVVHDWYWGTYEGGMVNEVAQARVVRAFRNLGVTDNPRGEIYRACLLSASDVQALQSAEKVRVRAARPNQSVQSWTTDVKFARDWTFGKVTGKWVGVVLGARFAQDEMLCNTEGLINLLSRHRDAEPFEGVDPEELDRLLGDLRTHFRGEQEVVVLQEGDTEVLDVHVVAQ